MDRYYRKGKIISLLWLTHTTYQPREQNFKKSNRPATFSTLSTRLTFLPGLAFCGLIAFIASYAGQQSWTQRYGLSALTIAIILGMVIGNTWYKHAEIRLASGVALSKQTLLRLGIILYGFRLTFHDVLSVDVEGIISDAFIVCSTFYWLF